VRSLLAPELQEGKENLVALLSVRKDSLMNRLFYWRKWSVASFQEYRGGERLKDYFREPI